ncbi:phage tail tape measure protein [Sphingopyxis sp. 550A]
MANSVIARLAVHLGLETATFTSGSQKAKKEVGSLEKTITKAGSAIKGAIVGMLGAFAVDQIVRVTARALEFTAAIKQQAMEAGVTTAALQQLRYAGLQVGLTNNQITDGLKELTQKIGEAATGSKSAIAAFDDYGVSIRDANGHVKNAADVLPEVSDAFKALKSPAEQAAFAAKLFGEDLGPKMVPLLNQGSRAIDEYRDAAQQLGLVLTDAQIEKAAEAEKRMKALTAVLEVKIASAVSENADAILELADALEKLIKFAGDAAKAWRYFSNLDWSPSAPALTTQLQRMQMRDLGPGVELTDSAKAAIEVRKSAAFLRPSGGSLLMAPPKSSPASLSQSPWGPLVARPGLTRAVGGLDFGGTDLSKVMPGAGSAGWMQAANDTFGNIAKLSGEVAQKNEEARKALGEMASVHGPRLADELKKLTPELESLRAATQNILDRLFPDEAEVRRYGEELATLTAAMKAGQLSTEDYAKAVNALRREFNGFADLIANNQEIVSTGIGPTVDDALDSANASWDRFTKRLMNNSQDSRVAIAQTFEGLAQDVLSSLNNLSNSIRGGSFLDILSGVISLGLSLGKAGLFGKSVQGSLNKIPAYAGGTDWHPGGIALVGEDGPELVNMPRGASVTPNNDIRGLGGNVYHISGNLLTPEFWAMIQRGDVAAAQAGASGGVSQIQRRGSRRLA